MTCHFITSLASFDPLPPSPRLSFVSMRRQASIADSIHTLKIESTIGCDFSHAHEPTDFAEILQQCTTLRLLDMALIETPQTTIRPHNYLRHLPGYFPSNIEHLRFRASPSLADDMSSWLLYAADPAWLPNLKTISFHLDALD